MTAHKGTMCPSFKQLKKHIVSTREIGSKRSETQEEIRMLVRALETVQLKLYQLKAQYIGGIPGPLTVESEGL